MFQILIIITFVGFSTSLGTETSVPINSTNTDDPELNVTSTKLVRCISNPNTTIERVEIVNDTQLIKFLAADGNVTARDVPARCVLVMFYSKYGTFSSMAAPHFNALPRAFPDVRMVAINAMTYNFFNTQNGIVGIPSLLLFHNGKAVARFNDSDYTLDLFSKFLTRNTGIEAKEKSTVTSADFAGPVTCSPSQDTDIFLIASWSFVIFTAFYCFTKSSWWRWITESVQNIWRESEHLHVN